MDLATKFDATDWEGYPQRNQKTVAYPFRPCRLFPKCGNKHPEKLLTWIDLLLYIHPIQTRIGGEEESQHHQPQVSTSGGKLKSMKPLRHMASSKSTSKADMTACLYCCGLFRQKLCEKWIICGDTKRAHMKVVPDAMAMHLQMKCGLMSDLRQCFIRGPLCLPFFLKTRSLAICSDSHCKYKTNSYRTTSLHVVR